MGAWDTISVPGAGLALHPIAEQMVAKAGGTAHFIGYRHKPAFLAFPALLPLILLAARFVIQRVAPVAESWPPSREPPIVRLVPAEGQPAVYEALRSALLSPRLFATAFAIAAFVQVADAWTILQTFRTGISTPELDFTVMFVAMAGVSKAQTVALFVAAYTPQFLCILGGAVVVSWIFAHNLFFLRRVYQRSRMEGEDPAERS